MRLLEFEQAQGSVESHHLAHIASRVTATDEGSAGTDRRPVAPPLRRTNRRNWEFGVKDPAAPATPARKTVDIEQLQQRLEALEKRVKARLEHPATDAATRPELEKIRQRLTKIERNLTNELWAAKQREHSLLELLAQPPLPARIRKGAARMGMEAAHFRTQVWPVYREKIQATTSEWWHERRPEWCDAAGQAWQEALKKARKI